MWILFSVLTVLLWGTSDVLFKSSSSDDANSVPKLLAYNGIVLGVCSLLYLLIVGGRLSFEGILKYLPIALVYIASMVFYYMAMPLMKISIASPIANSSCMLTTLLCILVLKQSVTWLQWIAIGLIFIAILIMSLEKDKDIINEGSHNGRKSYVFGIVFALIYFLLDGTGSFLDDYILESSLSAEEVIGAYGLIYMIIGVVCFIIVKVKDKEYRFFKDRKKLAGSIIETSGQFTYVYAFEFGDAAIASPFIASFSAVSIILSRIFLKEKLKAKQYILAACMLIGMALLSIE